MRRLKDLNARISAEHRQEATGPSGPLSGSNQMSLTDMILWPGTKICQFFRVDPEGDAGLIRSMFNMIVYLVVILGFMWAAMG